MVFNSKYYKLLLLHHEINNILYKIFFIVPLNYLQFHQVWNISDKDYSFHKFLKSATTSGKILSRIKLKLPLNFVNVMSLCDILLIYVVALNNDKH